METAVKFEGGYYVIPITKSLLCLTPSEYERALRRGKHYRRAQAAEMRRRKAQVGGAYKTPWDEPSGLPGASCEAVGG